MRSRGRGPHPPRRPADPRREPGLPRGYAAIVRRALAKDPAERYASAAELVGALRRALHDDAGDTWVVPAPAALLQGSGSLAEAYADYNLAYTRFALGSCDGVLGLLDASERIQGHRHEIDRLRHAARKSCG